MLGTACVGGVMATEPRVTLNAFQQNRLMTTFHYIDRLLTDIEHVLTATDWRSPFPQYLLNVSAEQRNQLEAFIAILRRRMIELLGGEGLKPEPPRIPASRAIHSILTYVEIALEELRPRDMRGYGAVSEAAAEKLERLVAELDPMVVNMDRLIESATAASNSTPNEEHTKGKIA